MSDDDLAANPDAEDAVMHTAANFAEWCKRIDGMDRGRKRAYFRSEDPISRPPCAVVLPAPAEAAPPEATTADRQGFVDGVIAELQALDAVTGPVDSTIDALVGEAPAVEADQHAAAEGTGL